MSGHTRPLLLALAFLTLSVSETLACQCPRPDNESKMTSAERDSWSFDRAETVVAGRVTEVRAGDDIQKNGLRYVVANLRVNSVLKGNAPLGDMTLVTGFGTGDCGLAGALLVAVSGRDATLEVKKNPELPNEYYVSICGYGKLSPARKE